MKKLLKFMLNAVILILVCGFLFIQYLKSDFNNSFDQVKLSQLKSKIEKAEPIPTDFIEAYNHINPITSTNGILIDAIKGNYLRECPCLNVARMSFIHGENKLLENEYVLAWKLEKEFTQKQCLYLYAQQFDFLYNNKGIKSASEYFFHKKTDDLSYDEMATLILMFQNSSLYNPIKNPKLIEQKLNEIKTTVHSFKVSNY